ncbi:hypothetical protein Tco_0912577 [Tanacetum coccineum]
MEKIAASINLHGVARLAADRRQIAARAIRQRKKRQGTPIQANMDVKDADYFQQLLELKKAYRITGFSCEQTGPWERTLENPISLIFGRYIELIEIPSDGFLEHYFNFASYNELPARLNVINSILDVYKPLTGSTHRVMLQQTVSDEEQ